MLHPLIARWDCGPKLVTKCDKVMILYIRTFTAFGKIISTMLVSPEGPFEHVHHMVLNSYIYWYERGVSVVFTKKCVSHATRVQPADFGAFPPRCFFLRENLGEWNGKQGSMYGMFTYMWLVFTAGKYISPMDPTGISHSNAQHSFKKIQENSIRNIPPNPTHWWDSQCFIPKLFSLHLFLLVAPTPIWKKKVPYNGKEISPYNWVILKFPTVNISHLTP